MSLLSDMTVTGKRWKVADRDKRHRIYRVMFRGDNLYDIENIKINCLF